MKINLLYFITITSIFTNNVYTNHWNNAIYDFNNNNISGSKKNIINTYDYDNNSDYNYNIVTQSDLDEVDKFINDFLIGSTNNNQDYSVSNNNFLNSIMVNNNRKLSYDVTDNKYNNLGSKTDNYNINIKPVSISNNNKINSFNYDNKPMNRNNTCKVLPSMQKYIDKQQNQNIIQYPIESNYNSTFNYTLMPPVNNQLDILSDNQLDYEKINIQNKNTSVINHPQCIVIKTPTEYNTSSVKQKGINKQIVTNTETSILTNSEINRFINNHPQINRNNNAQNNIKTQGQKNNDNLENILPDSYIDNLLNNNNRQLKTNTDIRNNSLSKVLTNDEIDKLFSSADPNIIIPIKIYDNKNVKSNKNKLKLRDNIYVNNNINNSKKHINKSKIPQLNIKNNNNNVNIDKCLSDRKNTIESTNTRKIINVKKVDSKKHKRCLSKEPVGLSNKIKSIRLLNKKKILKVIRNTSINTDWEMGINQNDINTFFENINNSNAFENMKMQVYSLLGEMSPSFGDNDKIRLILDIINYNKNNRDEKHNYNYNKSLALAGIFTDYYLNNIDLYNENTEQFNKECLDLATNILLFNKKDYDKAVNIIHCNSFYNIINKIVKGVNFIENFKNNRVILKKKLVDLKLSNGKRQNWFISTFKLFDYALQYSSENDAIRNTLFAKFDNYLQNNSKYRDIKEGIKLIPTLKSFVKQSNEKFDNTALKALYGEEDSDIACYGIMGSILMFRIFPELKSIFSSNQFGINDSIISLANKFHFSNNQSLAKQFNEQASKILDIANYYNGKKLFNNTDYLIIITSGLTRDQVINDRRYISRYNTENILAPNISNNIGNKLELYELIGVQLCSNGNNDYISITDKQLDNAINAQNEFGKYCINKNLQPMQTLYKRVLQNEV